MPFIVVYDANVLYGNTQRDLMLRIALTGLVQAKWTDEILDEAMEAIARNRPDIDPARLARTRQLMVDAVPDCIVRGYEPLMEGLRMSDPDDRHVLAAAIKSGAQVIVTADKGFAEEDLTPWKIEAKDPMTSFSTRSTSTTSSSGAAFSRSLTQDTNVPRRSTTC
jgi:predicted nucleic acid-binding protein